MGLKQSTLNFLKELSLNNDRAWFADHKEVYEDARLNVIDLAENTLHNLTTIDPFVPEDLSLKKAVLRIYRDVRFSKNKDPYKSYFGVWFPAYGSLPMGPGYYLHIEPNHSFIGAGYWMPSPAHLKMIRQEIDYNSEAFHEIVQNPIFKKTGSFSTTEILVNAPKGYDPTHKDIEFLKLKSFEVSKLISDEQLTKGDFVLQLTNYFKILMPYVAFIRNAITD